jgi:hypothetical protein
MNQAIISKVRTTKPIGIARASRNGRAKRSKNPNPQRKNITKKATAINVPQPAPKADEPPRVIRNSSPAIIQTRTIMMSVTPYWVAASHKGHSGRPRELVLVVDVPQRWHG